MLVWFLKSFIRRKVHGNLPLSKIVCYEKVYNYRFNVGRRLGWLVCAKYGH
jgi:hypothetical protein